VLADEPTLPPEQVVVVQTTTSKEATEHPLCLPILMDTESGIRQKRKNNAYSLLKQLGGFSVKRQRYGKFRIYR